MRCSLTFCPFRLRWERVCSKNSMRTTNVLSRATSDSDPSTNHTSIFVLFMSRAGEIKTAPHARMARRVLAKIHASVGHMGFAQVLKDYSLATRQLTLCHNTHAVGLLLILVPSTSTTCWSLLPSLRHCSPLPLRQIGVQRQGEPM